MQSIRRLKGGFALPTVLIASVVMLTVLTVSVSSVVAVRTTLQTQYYEQLAKTAGEAGVAYAKACLAKNGNVPLWTNAKPLTPATDCAGNITLSPAVDVLVVAGGGGGANNHGGGGGGGGVIESSSISVSAQPYSVVVGAGGAGGSGSTGTAGTNGVSSTAFGLTAIGGGGGGGRIGNNSVTQAKTGGSGGGGAGTLDGSTGHAGYGGSGTASQGNTGGNGTSDATAGNGGGGGGAGTAGGNASGTGANQGISGAGGAGKLSTISGATYSYGAGGSGGRWAAGNVGLAGVNGGGAGGNADSVAGTNGVANSGGGGGGGGGGAANGGAGGSGVVIIAYPNSGVISATGGNSVYQSGIYKVHKFTSTGTSTFDVDSVGTASCPTDPRCAIVAEENLRSSFSIGLPTLDAEGKALAIPNNGYVELLRSSNGAVWRTYRQPSVQAAVVPGLCSGAATSSLGWSNAVVTVAQSTLPNASAARNISLVDGPMSAGYVYFRKDFVVTTSGSYTVTANTPSSSDKVEMYIDGTLVTTAQGSVKSGTISLTPGCHIATARLTNVTVQAAGSNFIAAVQRNGADSAPVVVSDSDWRVSSGAVVDFSSPDFYADPQIWTPVSNYQTPTVQLANTAWQSYQNDVWTRMVSSSGSGCAAACPALSTSYMRDSRDFYLAADTEVMVSAVCDDNCAVYIDGQAVFASAPWNSIGQQTITIPAGRHHVGMSIYNGGPTTGPSGGGVSLVRKSDGLILTRTDLSWIAATTWFSSPPSSITSFESSYVPSPNEIPIPTTMDVLVVAAGGGGAGNCTSCGGAGGGGGGGVINAQKITPTISSYTVSVGSGGAGGANNTTSGGMNGGNSQFGAFTALGGGGGMGQNGTAGKVGGSGGGGSGGGTPGPGAGGAGTTGQGYAGGAGAASPYAGGGGGGAGGAGVAGAGSLSGNGGAGFISYIDGTRRVFGAGGGGGTYGSSYFAGAGETGSAGNGSATGAGSGGTSNTGGGGGGANGNPVGASGGPGGSGVVYLRFVKNSLTVGTITGALAYSSSDVTLNGVVYTVYRFYGGTGTFPITAVN